MASPLVRLKGAGLRRDGRWLVRGVDLEVYPREIVTLIGPNGSGKSTTTKLVLALAQPDEGAAMRKNGLTVGYVPQKITIDWSLPLTVERFMSLTQRHGTIEIKEALEATQSLHLLKSSVRTLSGGELQRVLLARAIVGKPELLLLDEPVQGVDFTGEIALYELIGRIRDEIGCGILLVSHDLHVVMAATDRVICFNGHVCCSGTPVAVSESPEYKRLFGARAAASFAIYRHDHDHTHLPDGRVRHADGSLTDHCHNEDGHHKHGQHENGDQHHDHSSHEDKNAGGQF